MKKIIALLTALLLTAAVVPGLAEEADTLESRPIIGHYRWNP